MAPVQTLLFFLIPTLVTGNTDPCNNYQSINNPYRSPKYRVSPGEPYICDNRLIPGWYRFTSIVGGKMPTVKPQTHHCGTIAPMWMKGTHPTTKGQVNQATACTNLYNRRNGCLWPQPMSVKDCGDFFVYELRPSRSCSMAYCAGDLMPCPRGPTGIVLNCTALSNSTTGPPTTPQAPTTAKQLCTPSTQSITRTVQFTTEQTPTATTKQPTSITQSTAPTVQFTTEQAPTATTKQPTAPITKSVTESTIPTGKSTTKHAPTTTEQQSTTATITTEAENTTESATSTRQSTTQQGETTPSVEETTPTETRETTTTEKPKPTTSLKEEYVIKAEIRLIIEWKEDLKDKESTAFRQLAKGLKKEIRDSFTKSDNGEEPDKVIILSFKPFRPGIVVAEFKLVFKKRPQKDPLAPMKKSVKNGKLGTWTVDPESLKQVKENKETPSEKDHTLLIVLVVVGIIAVLIIAAVIVKIGRKKHEHHLKRRVSGLGGAGTSSADGKHLENDPERYEMKEAWKSQDQRENE